MSKWYIVANLMHWLINEVICCHKQDGDERNVRTRTKIARCGKRVEAVRVIRSSWRKTVGCLAACVQVQ